MPLIGTVTDDFTGAASSGMMMAKEQVKTGLFFDDDLMMKSETVKELDAVYVSTNSRALPPEAAYNRVKKTTSLLKELGVSYFSKKIDTTMRGGIGHEVDAMLDVLGENTVGVMVTAMPPSKRICVGGYSIIDSTILNETSVAEDVKTPVKQCYVPHIMQKQTKRKVGLITIDQVQQGEEVLSEELQKKRQDGCGVIIVDAVSMEHVGTIARACLKQTWNTLAIDPGPFTMKLAVERGFGKAVVNEKEEIREKSDKTVLIVAGSANPSTKKQMGLLFEQETDCKQISVNPSAILKEQKQAEEEIHRAAEEAEKLLMTQKAPKVILIETALHGELLNLSEEDKRRGVRGGQSSEDINRALGEITKRILEKNHEKIAGMMLTGGDTMESVCRAIGTTYIQAVDNIVAQVDVGRIAGRYEGMPLVVKGGFCGYDNVGTDIVNRLLEESER